MSKYIKTIDTKDLRLRFIIEGTEEEWEVADRYAQVLKKTEGRKVSPAVAWWELKTNYPGAIEELIEYGRGNWRQEQDSKVVPFARKLYDKLFDD